MFLSADGDLFLCALTQHTRVGVQGELAVTCGFTADICYWSQHNDQTQALHVLLQEKNLILSLHAYTRPATTQCDKVMYLMLLFTCCFLSVWLLMPLIWCGKAEQRQSASLTCLKCLSHLILEPSEKCSPRWKDEAIQNGNIYPPSQHSFSSSLSVWVSFGALIVNVELFN